MDDSLSLKKGIDLAPRPLHLGRMSTFERYFGGRRRINLRGMRRKLPLDAPIFM
jgi:hypothetical protein